VATNGSLADELEGVLVKSQCVVAALEPAPGTGDEAPTNEYLCEGGLRINDLIFLTTPFPLVGEILDVTGVLRLANEHTKIEPRGPDDVLYISTVEPGLSGFGPDLTFAEVTEGLEEAIPSLTLRLDRPAFQEGVTVSLSSSDEAALVVPETVSFVEGEDSAVINVQGLAPTEVPVTVTATLGEDILEVSVKVLSADRVPVLAALEPEQMEIVIGVGFEARVTITEPAAEGGALVALSIDEPGLVEFPETVLIPAGAFGADFTLTGLSEGGAALRASLSGSDVEAAVEVRETPPVGVVITEVFYDAAGGDDGLEWVEIYNGTSSPVDLSAYSLGSGGSDYTTLTVQLEGTIPPGGCFLVGGPTSNDDNGNPVFDQPLNFTPDIQNSGSTADAVALFDLPAIGIGSQTVPIDAVIYGSENSSGFLDEEGAIGAVDVGDASSGSSIERTPEGWAIQPVPTPNDCVGF
jgi:hypothetical protein